MTVGHLAIAWSVHICCTPQHIQVETCHVPLSSTFLFVVYNVLADIIIVCKRGKESEISKL